MAEAPTFREHQRLPLVARVSCQFSDDSEAIIGNSANVGEGGLFIAVADPRAVGTMLRIEMELQSTWIKGFAEVAWIRVRDDGPERPRGMGVQFRFLEGDGLDRVRRLVEEGLARLAKEQPTAAARRPTRGVPPARPRPSAASASDKGARKRRT